MGLDRRTAMELCGNPRDLHFSIMEGPPDKFSFVIARGPGHNFKMMLSSKPFARTQNEAIETVENILKVSREVVEKEIPDKSGSETNGRLNEKMVKWIVGQLRKKGVASTFKAPKKL